MGLIEDVAGAINKGWDKTWRRHGPESEDFEGAELVIQVFLDWLDENDHNQAAIHLRDQVEE